MRLKNGYGNAIRRGACVAALAYLWTVGAHAQTRAEQKDFQAFLDLAQGTAKHTVGLGSNGTPIVTKGVPGPSAVGNTNIYTNGGAPYAEGKAHVPLPSGNGKTAEVTVRQPITKQSAGKALAALGKSLPVLGTGIVLWEFAKEMGWTLGKNSDGTVIYQKEVQEYFQACPGHTYAASVHASNNLVTSTKYCVRERPDNLRWVAGWSHQSQSYGWPGLNFSCGYWNCKTGNNDQVSAYLNITGPSKTIIPKTEQEFIDEIASASGWPSSSKIGTAVAEAIKAGNPVEVEKATVTGPATAPGPTTTTTTTKPDGTTSTATRNVTYNISYLGDTITINETTNITTNNYNPTTNTTTTETTQEQKEPDSKDPCESGQNTLGCMKLDNPEQPEIPKKQITVTYAQESLFGGGSCPAPIGWNDKLGAHSIDLAPVCGVLTSIVRPLVIAFALLSAYFIIGGFRQE